MKKQKLVSIIVQAYNSADTIVRTLESIKAQTYSKIELIVTDDKSKDQTIETKTALYLIHQPQGNACVFRKQASDA